VKVSADAARITVVLDDGREVSASVPEYFPFLEDLSEKELRRTTLIDDGMAIYFPSIEEYASVFSVVHPEKTVLAASLRRPVRRQSVKGRAEPRARSRR
jgi:hypothetical protein